MTSRRRGGKEDSDWTYSEGGDGRAGEKKGCDPETMDELEQPTGNHIPARITDPEGAGNESIQPARGMSNVRDFSRAKNEMAYVSGGLNDLLSGVSNGTQSAYKTAWAKRSQFTPNHPTGA